ncbi:MAG TPA: hypothetical protein PLN54_01125 [Flavobacteriales bacterium]|nr:hypothetical protein [Flavobacteriales bacterium]
MIIRVLSREIIRVCHLRPSILVVLLVSTLSPKDEVLKRSVVFLYKASTCTTEAFWRSVRHTIAGSDDHLGKDERMVMMGAMPP